MYDQLPLQLVLGWALLFAFFCAQHQHERMIKTSQIQATSSLLRALEISGVLAMVSMVGILIYYFINVRWYGCWFWLFQAAWSARSLPAFYPALSGKKA